MSVLLEQNVGETKIQELVNQSVRTSQFCDPSILDWSHFCYAS